MLNRSHLFSFFASPVLVLIHCVARKGISHA